jgi:hypothetical protein
LLESEGSGNSICATAQCADLYVSVSEDAGAGFTNYWLLGVANTASNATFDFDSSSSSGTPLTTDAEGVLYGHAVQTNYSGPSGPVESGMSMVEEGYVSERGSVFNQIDNTTVTFDMAHVLAKCVWIVKNQ